ncbi:melibiase [Thermoflavifilum aggregans]|uniref:Melibiase n=2 Tax=Thermoflavifilum aggregans TaxID=454188 RepID=A0A2M9CU36_9BACT|nr:melibiase [Thermoflavifilum aggregans]
MFHPHHMFRRHMLMFACLLTYLFSHAQQVQITMQQHESEQIFTLSNEYISQRIVLQHGMLQEEQLLDISKPTPTGIFDDGGYAFDLMWTGWNAPGKYFNGDLHVELTQHNFIFRYAKTDEQPNGAKILHLYFKAIDPENPLWCRLSYEMLPGKTYVRRQVALSDSTGQDHWLAAVYPRRGEIAEIQHSISLRYGMHEETSMHIQQQEMKSDEQHSPFVIIKKGDFGQPVAVDFRRTAVFWGTEYPAAVNRLTTNNNQKLILTCKEWMGNIIDSQWLCSDWVVEGLSPKHHLQEDFYQYLTDIQVRPDRPYTLYNSWYDLRSPAFKDVAPQHIMNESNILRLIQQFQQNMIQPYGIHLDAFVLDDGWDEYASPWQLRKSTFPHGLQPIVNALKPLHTSLGIWIGPTGGYSFRMQRINWMKAHGYETVGNGPNNIMLDITGPNYFNLLKSRAIDFTKQGVGYFKWDGIQFSSSEPGRPAMGYFSERTALHNIAAMADTVRKLNPDMYINITSGTWMSPWWLKIADQIWMQGADYGFSTTPSILSRDAAMTYKDMVLYDDYRMHDVWFPMNHVMTHGIIKARLASVGKDDDPLESFANDVMLYFGRGVSMYELYISPDIFTADEWRILSEGLKWAKSRYSVLRHTFMVGGNPALGEPYGYVHFQGDSGIIVVRNPQMHAQNILIKLDPAQGINAEARNLVIERVYPTHWIAPDIYSAGGTLSFSLQGFETAVYEVYPLQDAHRPLLSNAVFDMKTIDSKTVTIHVLDTTGPLKWLNPSAITNVQAQGQPSQLFQMQPRLTAPQLLSSAHLQKTDTDLLIQFVAPQTTETFRCVVFLYPDSLDAGKPLPDCMMQVDGKPVKPVIQQSPGQWMALSDVISQPGAHKLTLQFDSKDQPWHGKAEVWAMGYVQTNPASFTCTFTGELQIPDMPPSAYPGQSIPRQQFIGSIAIATKAK